MKKKIILAIVVLPFLIFFIFLLYQHISNMNSEISDLRNRIIELEDKISELKDEIRYR